MRYLILSDIHGNREALEAVLADARGRYDQILSCGDLCDYGPDSNYVIDWARQNLAASIRGNHDRVCSGLDSYDEFSDLAQASAQWTREHLTPANRTYLRELQQGPALVDSCLVLVHGSPQDEDEYVSTMEDASGVFGWLQGGEANGVKADAFPLFFGHTHAQAVFARAGGRTRRVSPPLTPVRETLVRLERDAAHLINPGSVGQPRDGDPRAAYAVYDAAAREVALRRAPYDFMATERKIAAAGLPVKLGIRLGFGR